VPVPDDTSTIASATTLGGEPHVFTYLDRLEVKLEMAESLLAVARCHLALTACHQARLAAAAAGRALDELHTSARSAEYAAAAHEERGKGRSVLASAAPIADGRAFDARLDDLADEHARVVGALDAATAQVRRALSNPYLGLYLSLSSPYLCHRAGAASAATPPLRTL